MRLNIKNVLKKIGKYPKCYLTGRTIDLTNTTSYHFDHIIPITKGGNNDLNNFNIACKDANIAKSNLLLEDFIKLCKEILEYNGYQVTKLAGQN